MLIYRKYEKSDFIMNRYHLPKKQNKTKQKKNNKKYLILSIFRLKEKSPHANLKILYHIAKLFVVYFDR